MGTAQGSPGSPAKDAFESSYLQTYGVEVTHPFMAEHYDATVLVALAAAKAGTNSDSSAIRDAAAGRGERSRRGYRSGTGGNRAGA